LAVKSIFEPLNETRSKLGIKPADRLLAVRLGASTLQYYLQNVLVRSYVVSTSRLPPSNLKNSLGTPRGLHEIAERIGAGQPAGMVFESRIPTGRHFSEMRDVRPEANLVATRILWLRGLEPGVNLGGEVDSYERYIYIHGTNREDRIGQPASAGCILMRNVDIIQLYDEVRVGDQVYITD
jgi:hypothetical protein